ncbi:hypothetical protein [Sorangium sp. So ce233]|uniref:hypothetical protein n=1 Tax=Sorangium sp. So ce233 TaxID=3133290 RepID=UPI003F605794
MRSHLLDVLAAVALLVMPAACSGAKGAHRERCACAPPASIAPTPTTPASNATEVVTLRRTKIALHRTKVTECNALIQIINEGIENLEMGSKAGADQGGSSELRAMAKVMDEVAADAAQVKLTTPELQKFSWEYQTMAKDVAKAARHLATAADANDAESSSTAQTAIEKAIGQEDPLVDKINQFCRAP